MPSAPTALSNIGQCSIFIREMREHKNNPSGRINSPQLLSTFCLLQALCGYNGLLQKIKESQPSRVVVSRLTLLSLSQTISCCLECHTHHVPLSFCHRVFLFPTNQPAHWATSSIPRAALTLRSLTARHPQILLFAMGAPNWPTFFSARRGLVV